MRLMTVTLALFLYVGQAFAFQSQTCSNDDGSIRSDSMGDHGRNEEKWTINKREFKPSEIVAEEVKDTYRVLEEKHTQMVGGRTFTRKMTFKYEDEDIGKITTSAWMICTFSMGI